jgi:hypothetical protein
MAATAPSKNSTALNAAMVVNINIISPHEKYLG